MDLHAHGFDRQFDDPPTPHQPIYFSYAQFSSDFSPVHRQDMPQTSIGQPDGRGRYKIIIVKQNKVHAITNPVATSGQSVVGD